MQGFKELPRSATPLPGDIGYLTAHGHMFLVSTLSGGKVMSVNGNSGSTGVIQMEPRALSSITSFYRLTALG